MVKPDAGSDVALRVTQEIGESPAVDLGADLTRTLRLEGQKLSQTKHLIQKAVITPLQLHDVGRSVDPLLVAAQHPVAVLTDANGQSAIAVAKARPHWQVTGWVPDTKTLHYLQNQTQAGLPNLLFEQQETTAPAARPQAIMAVSWAHQILSRHEYHVSALLHEVRRLLDMLPDHGQLLIQDFALPDDHDQFVMLDLENDEAVDALLEFSHKARPLGPKMLQGFFVETLPSPRKGVDRFRLPMKWAVEFYHRWRHGIAVDAPYELTTLSLSQWQALIEQCGARVTYRAPHPLERGEAKDIARNLRFLDEQGEILPLPAVTFTLVVEKLPVQAALTFYERRIALEKAQDIVISGIKNIETDEKLDVVEIRHHEDDLLPWYLDDEGRVHVLVRSNVARPIINSVPRGTPNLDGRQWAGYLVDALTLPHLGGPLDQKWLQEEWARLLPDYDGFTGEAKIGIEYYPAPEYLVQRVRGIFLALQPKNNAKPLPMTAIGTEIVQDVLADDVLRAISAGLIPDGKLEILIGQLMMEIGIQPLDTGKFLQQPETKKVLKYNRDRREAKVPRSLKSGTHLGEYINDTPTENLRAVRSVFVEDQFGEFGRHVAQAVEQDFIVSSGLSANTAICVPLMRDPMGKFLISGEPRQMPIPNRMGTEEPMMHLPSFSLPGHIKTVDQARLFIAKTLECDPEDLFSLGPSFFAQPQISAERLYPFAVSAAPNTGRWMRWFRPRGALNKLVCPQAEKTTAYLEFKALRDLGEWQTGFTPDITHAVTQKSAPVSDPGIVHLNRHPMLGPKPG